MNIIDITEKEIFNVMSNLAMKVPIYLFSFSKKWLHYALLKLIN